MPLKFKITTSAVCADCGIPARKQWVEYGTAEDFGNRMVSDVEAAAIPHFETLGWIRNGVDGWYCPKDAAYHRRAK